MLRRFLLDFSLVNFLYHLKIRNPVNYKKTREVTGLDVQLQQPEDKSPDLPPCNR